MSSPAAIILDLGNVVFTWTERPQGLPLKEMMKTFAWAQHQCGQLTDEECFQALGTTFAVPASTIRTKLADARASLSTNDRLIEQVRGLKQTHGLALYAMSNISREDMDYLRRHHPDSLAIFDDIFASGEVGFRKPDKRLYHHLLDQTGFPPDHVVFVDDLEENVCAARRLGMQGIHFDSPENFGDQLQDWFAQGMVARKEGS